MPHVSDADNIFKDWAKYLHLVMRVLLFALKFSMLVHARIPLSLMLHDPFADSLRKVLGHVVIPVLSSAFNSSIAEKICMSLSHILAPVTAFFMRNRDA